MRELEDLKREFNETRLQQLAESEGLAVRFRRMACPTGCSADPRGASIQEKEGVGLWHCHRCQVGGTAIDLLMHRRGLDEAGAIRDLKTLAGRLPPPPPRLRVETKDGGELWARLSREDPEGEQYLASRGLERAVIEGLVRFNVGATGDEWLDQKARAGYRVAFALQSPAGEVVSFQLRAVREASPSKLSLASVPTAGLAFGDTLGARTAPMVFLTEGLADTLALCLTGACTVGADGEGKLRATPAFLGEPKGRTFVLCPQNDTHEKSQTSFEGLRTSLLAAGARLEVLTTPDTYKDPAEWLEAVGLEEFKQAVAPRMKLGRVEEPPERKGGICLVSELVLTETGLAEQLAKRHETDLRYCAEWKRWVLWNGQRWRQDISGGTQRYVKALLRDLRAAAVSPGDKAISQFLFAAEKRSTRESIESLTRCEESMQVELNQLDAKGMLLNCRNGIVDLGTGELLPHAPEHLLMKQSPVVYDPDAQCPLWEAFLDRVFGSDQEVISYVQKAVGYSLTADIGEQVFFILWGSGANGKSTFLLTLMEMLGDYARPGVADLLMAKRNEGHPTELADLFGARFVVFQETAEGLRFDESRVKALTGGDKIKARRMREDFWEFTPTHKFWLGTNHRPAIRGTDHAIWRRVRLIPFNVTIPPAERDPKLLQRLRDELPGILAWAVRGCSDWQQKGLKPPRVVTEAVEEYRQGEDRLAPFFGEHCIEGTGKVTLSKELYDAYRQWAAANGETEMSAIWFAKRLVDRGYVSSERGHRKQKVWEGVGLLASKPEAATSERYP